MIVKTLKQAKNIWKQIPVGRAKDFTGQKINKWTILYRTEDPKRPMWVAQCECGNYGRIRGGQFSKQCQECAHKAQQRDYTGLRFGILTCAAERQKRNGKTYIKCICDCGNETWVSNGNLTSGQVKSCGCLSHIYHGHQLQDLTGRVFNDLTILNFAFTQDGQRYWHCKCKCGNEKDVSTRDLNSNRVKSCGCRKYLQIKPGDRFGKLVVIKKVENKLASNGQFLFECKCDCGTPSHIVRGSCLVNGTIKSCGCGRNISYNEEYIYNLLTQQNLHFIKEYEDQKINKIYPTGGRNRSFDFFVEETYIIEFDGQQHFYYTGSGWDTKQHFQRTRKSDLIKNKYCFDNNIPLIRIPYDAEYTIDDLKLETTRFLLTPENEKEYYESRSV